MQKFGVFHGLEVQEKKKIEEKKYDIGRRDLIKIASCLCARRRRKGYGKRNG